MNIEVIKILAYGNQKRFVWLKINDEVLCTMINKRVYTALRTAGAITCQSLKKKN